MRFWQLRPKSKMRSISTLEICFLIPNLSFVWSTNFYWLSYFEIFIWDTKLNGPSHKILLNSKRFNSIKLTKHQIFFSWKKDEFILLLSKCRFFLIFRRFLRRQSDFFRQKTLFFLVKLLIFAVIRRNFLVQINIYDSILVK